MSEPLNFQQVILKLHQFWADQGCVIWEPYNIQLGAGTGNPATLLRVLGPEPWRVAYVEPSVRPDDGRYGENPNRMQKFYQYQVILKPDPGNPQELYLQSLEALGIDPRKHDIRFVEDNWESPALGAWGLGWEVWLDGQEITQFTYFQQAGGQELNPPSVEITYGLERIVLALQDKDSAWNIDWMPGLSYKEMMFNEEVEHCKYYFELADVDSLKSVYDIYVKEFQLALDGDAVISAYDYVLKCSHLFNVLDARGAIGVTERAYYFRRMRDMTLKVTERYAAKREELGHPLLSMKDIWAAPQREKTQKLNFPQRIQNKPADVLLEIGVEELPAADVETARQQLIREVFILFSKLRIAHHSVRVYTTPRRIVIFAKDVAPQQKDMEEVVKGPPANRAFAEDGKPTKAAQGFARSKGIDVADLRVQTIDGGEYVTANVKTKGQPTVDVLKAVFPELIASIKFPKSMRWNETNIAFSRPIRWILAIFGDEVIPFSYAGVTSDSITRGLRPYGSPEIDVDNPSAYFKVMTEQGIILDQQKRHDFIVKQISRLARRVDGYIPDDPELLDEVSNLVEAPTALRGTFDERFLDLPREVLVTVMRKHQRYFPVENNDGDLLPYFIAVRNGDDEHLDLVIKGNEQVIRARFSDADFFYKEDMKKPLAEYLPRLATLTFQEKLGSMLDKNQRVAGLVVEIGDLFGMDFVEVVIAEHAAEIAKADLATNMVIEMTSLQGAMGREYARKNGYPLEVADVVYEHWLPRNAEDALPSTPAAMLLGTVDRLDSLVGLFAAGLAPKSTADPYGLRRAALGIIQLMCGHTLDADLALAVDVVAKAQPIAVSNEIKQQVLDFITGRLQVWLGEQGHPTDVINAVLAEQSGNPYRAMNGARELSKWVERDDWGNILDGFARCVRITRKETEQYTINPELFQQEEEHALYAAYQQAAKTLTKSDNVDGFLNAFVPVLPAVTGFFGTGKGDGVMVHAEDPALRQNRLGLLQAISDLQKGRADLGELAGF